MTTNLLDLPAVSAIYRVWHYDHVVYVGQTINLKNRWKNHHILPKLLAHYGLDWRLDWVEVDQLYLDRAEAFAYRHFSPALNQRNPSNLLGFQSEQV
jgi:hypothetical protein